MVAEPFRAVIEPATIWAFAEDAAKTSTKKASPNLRSGTLKTRLLNTSVCPKNAFNSE